MKTADAAARVACRATRDKDAKQKVRIMGWERFGGGAQVGGDRRGHIDPVRLFRRRPVFPAGARGIRRWDLCAPPKPRLHLQGRRKSQVATNLGGKNDSIAMPKTVVKEPFLYGPQKISIRRHAHRSWAQFIGMSLTVGLGASKLG